MRRAGLILAVVFLATAPVLATTLLWMDVQDLTRNSTSIVMGRVEAQTVLSSGPGVPLTQVLVKIDRSLKGGLEGAVLVNNPGFDGAPVFKEGEEVVLFLFTQGGTHVLTGFPQGSFKIVTDELGRKVLDRALPSKNRSIATIRSVDTLISEIKAAME